MYWCYSSVCVCVRVVCFYVQKSSRSIAFLWRLLCNLYGILIHTNTHERYYQCFIFRSFFSFCFRPLFIHFYLIGSFSFCRHIPLPSHSLNLSLSHTHTYCLSLFLTFILVLAHSWCCGRVIIQYFSLPKNQMYACSCNSSHGFDVLLCVYQFPFNDFTFDNITLSA